MPAADRKKCNWCYEALPLYDENRSVYSSHICPKCKKESIEAAKKGEIYLPRVFREGIKTIIDGKEHLIMFSSGSKKNSEEDYAFYS